MKSGDGPMKCDLKTRAKSLGVQIVRLYADLPKREEIQVIGSQILRSGTFVAAHWQRAKSVTDFINTMQTGLRKLEETEYWLNLLEEAGIVPKERLDALQREVHELLGIYVTVTKAARRKE